LEAAVKYRMIRHGTILAWLVLTAMLFPGTSPLSAFPGQNDSIAIDSVRDDVVNSMSADGSGPTRLTNNPAVDVEPAFSPDGAKFAFSSDHDGNTEIYVMNADGSG
jgi:Tol biopolymer transport system component